MPTPLPIDVYLPEIALSLGRRSCAVLRAPTGTGKTTRVAPALLDAGLAGERALVLVEPRRLAARAAARRIAEERGARVGGEVGYAVRFDRRSGPRTRILVVTEGVFLRMLQEDPFLEGFGVVLFDEFHERNLGSDLALAMVRRVREQARADLKVVVMSATLEPEPLQAFLEGCPSIDCAGSLHDVTVEHARGPRGRALEDQVLDAVASLLDRVAGDLLVFLPGLAEIRRCGERIAGTAARHDASVHELYGDLPAEKQDAVLRPGDRRKVILATNVAETSITIEGIEAVVDSGLHRLLRFDPAAGLDRLELERISRVSATQRAGRAGRTGPGICLRLWSEAEHRALAEHTSPEIRRVDLAGPVLQLACWGETDPAAFPWFEAPEPTALARANELLRRLGALEDHGRATVDGRAMARLPVHPRLGRLLLEGGRLGDARRVALAAALLAERDPFLRPRPGAPAAAHRTPSDVLDRVEALEEFERSGRRAFLEGELHAGGARFLLRARDQILRVLEAEGELTAPGDTAGEPLLRALLAAFPDRVARRREPRSRRGILVGGRGVRLARESGVVESDLFLAVDLDAGRRGERAEAVVRLASGIERDWLREEAVRVVVAVEFDAARGRVVAVRRVHYEDLVLEEGPAPLPEGEDVARLLAREAAARPGFAGIFDAEEIRDFLARAACLREWLPELGIPPFDEARLADALPEIFAGARSFAEVRHGRVLAVLRARLRPDQLAALDREAPERIEVPSGSRIRVRYEPGKPPVLAVRIQEMFGAAETPRIASGRVRVLLHLLAPNLRTEQVTEDLRSFWDRTYLQVRKDLRRRYPKHAWPEDPWAARPERRPRRKG